MILLYSYSTIDELITYHPVPVAVKPKSSLTSHIVVMTQPVFESILFYRRRVFVAPYQLSYIHLPPKVVENGGGIPALGN